MSAAFHKPGDGWYGRAHGRVVGPFESAEKANEIANAIPSYMVRPGMFPSYADAGRFLLRIMGGVGAILVCGILLFALLCGCGLMPDADGNFPLNNDHPTNWLDNQK